MFTLIVMTRANGYSTAQFGKYEDAEEKAVAVTLADKETTAVIYNHAGKLIWRAFGKVAPPPPVATDDEWRVRDTQAEIEDGVFSDLKTAIRDAKAQAVRYNREFQVLTKMGRPHFIAVPNPRSIFSDVDANK